MQFFTWTDILEFKRYGFLKIINIYVCGVLYCKIEKTKNVRFTAERIQNNVQTYLIYIVNYIF